MLDWIENESSFIESDRFSRFSSFSVTVEFRRMIRVNQFSSSSSSPQ